HSSIFLLFSFLPLRPPPSSTLFPYTTLFRSIYCRAGRWRNQAVSQSVRWNVVVLRAGRHRDRLAGLNCLRIKRGQPRRGIHFVQDRKSTRLNSSHLVISYAVFCLKKKKKK